MSLFENFVYKNGEIVDNSWVKWCHFGVSDKEGERRNINISIIITNKNDRQVEFISGWMIHPLGLITCNTPLGG